MLFVEKTRNDLNQSVKSYEEMNPSIKPNTEPELSKRSVSNIEPIKMISVG